MTSKNSLKTTTIQPPSFVLNWSWVLSGVSAYSVAVGIAYLWGYWAPFGIPILNYMSVSDILTATAWPLLSLLSVILIGAMLGGQQSDLDTTRDNDKNRLGSFLLWYWSHLRWLHFLALFCIWAVNVPHQWELITVLGGVPLCIYILRQDWMEALQITRLRKVVSIFVLIAMPPLAINQGQIHSSQLMSGDKYQAIYSEVEGVAIPEDSVVDSRLRFIGQRGDTLFLWDAQKRRTVITKFPTGKPLIIGQVAKSNGVDLFSSLGRYLTKPFAP